MLVGEAKYWQDSTRKLLEWGRIIITWEVFRTKKKLKNISPMIWREQNRLYLSVGEYSSEFEELWKYSSTFFYHPCERGKCIKFENGLRPKLRKVVWILEIYDFSTLIHKYIFLEDFENRQNNKSSYFGPQPN